jgi:hypothetical protein
MHHGGRQTREPLPDGRSGRHLTLELRDARHHVARHHSGEERPLVTEVGIDRRLSGARRLGQLVDAGAFKSALHKYLARRIEDSRVNLPGKFLWRATKTPCGALCSRRCLLQAAVFHRELIQDPPPAIGGGFQFMHIWPVCK